MSFHPSVPRAVLLVAALALSACAGPRAAYNPAMIPELPTGEARCKVAASQSNPLVTEWPASEKANFEALLRQGSVAVSYSGCVMRVLPRCRLNGGYRWQRTTPASDFVQIDNEDDLYAKLPLGAVNLEAELKRSGHLLVQTIVAGLLRLENPDAVSLPDAGECAQATHIVEALSVGAFSLSTGSSAGGRANAGLFDGAVGIGGSTGGSGRIVRSSGEPQACSASTDDAPHPNCSAPVQVFLRALPGRGAEEGPPGTTKVDFVSANANSRWDVYIDDQVACTTPCSRWVDSSRPVLLRAREDGFMAAPDKIRMLNLGPDALGGPLQVQAHPTSRGELLTGITFTSFGGLALLSGITLSAVGCPSGRSDGMCTGGLISLAAGSLVTAGALWLIFDSAPRADIVPARTSASVGRW
jgi:hypothetical protein